MSRKAFTIPFILSTGNNPGDDIVIGGGTGEGGSDPVACSYDAWLRSVWVYDYNGDGYDFDDYCNWWLDQYAQNPNAFSPEVWSEFNNVPFPTEG